MSETFDYGPLVEAAAERLAKGYPQSSFLNENILAWATTTEELKQEVERLRYLLECAHPLVEEAIAEQLSLSTQRRVYLLSNEIEAALGGSRDGG